MNSIPFAFVTLFIARFTAHNFLYLLKEYHAARMLARNVICFGSTHFLVVLLIFLGKIPLCDATLVKINLSQDLSRSRAIAKKIEQLTYELPIIKNIQQTKTNKAYTQITLDHLDRGKAYIIAAALRENLKLQATIVEDKPIIAHATSFQSKEKNLHPLTQFKKIDPAPLKLASERTYPHHAHKTLVSKQRACEKKSTPTVVQTNAKNTSPTRLSETNTNAIKARTSEENRSLTQPSTITDKYHNTNKQHRSEREGYIWNAKQADIRELAASIADLTHKSFLISPRVQGKITFLSKTPLTTDEIYAAFLSALQIHGFAAIENDGVVKIILDMHAKHTAGRATLNNVRDQYLTRVVSVAHVPVQQLIPVIRPLLSQWDVLSTYTPSNKVILSGRQGNLDKLIQIIHDIDSDFLQKISMIPIKYGIADDITRTLRTLYASQEGLARRVTVATDENSNAILVSGSPSDRLRIQALIEKIDRPDRMKQHTSTQVIYLKYLQAKDLVPILAGVAKSMFSGHVGTTIGSMTIENAERIQIDSEGNPSSSQEALKKETNSKVASTKGHTGHSIEIIAEPNTNTIIINGPPNILQTLRHVIHQLDIRPAQIIVEALIAEINEDDINQLGIDWGTVVDNASRVAASNSGFQRNIGILTEHGFEDFQAILKMLSEDNKANILSTPSVMVLDNHKAHIAVGNEVSIEQSQYFNNNNTPTSTFTRKKVALILDVTPQINQGEAIRLLISHANNTLQNQGDTSGRPIFNVNEINTSVIINNGDVLVLGGLVKNEIRDNDKSIPILGELPLVRRLFHNHTKNSSHKKLMVFLHPLIIKNKSDTAYYSNQKYDFMRAAQLEFMRHHHYQPQHNAYVLPKRVIQPLPKPFKE